MDDDLDVFNFLIDGVIDYPQDLGHFGVAARDVYAFLHGRGELVVPNTRENNRLLSVLNFLVSMQMCIRMPHGGSSFDNPENYRYTPFVDITVIRRS